MRLIVLRTITIATFATACLLFAAPTTDQECMFESNRRQDQCYRLYCPTPSNCLQTHLQFCLHQSNGELAWCLRLNEVEAPPIPREDGICDESVPFDPDCPCPQCP